jgi:LysR family glycine cleavage system transcriptional activator
MNQSQRMTHQSGTEHRDPHDPIHFDNATRAISPIRRSATNDALSRRDDKISPPPTSVRLPSLNGLCAFEAAARHLSFAGAAAELGVTRTAVSHQIRRLEEQLDVRLFVRLTASLALSKAGEAYLPDVRAAFDRLRVASRRLQVRPRQGRVLTVSTTPTLAAKWLVPRLPAFNAAFPDIEVRIGATMRLVDFAREPVDVAIRYGCGDWPGLRSDRLAMTDAFFPVCSPTLMRGTVPLRTPSDLAVHTLLYVEHERYEWRSGLKRRVSRAAWQPAD